MNASTPFAAEILAGTGATIMGRNMFGGVDGGTTFHFVTDGIESALEQAGAAASKKDVSLGGGATVAQQYLSAGLGTREAQAP